MSIAPTTHVESALPDYLAGALTEDERQAVEWHLRACESCAQARDAFAILFAEKGEPTDTPSAAYFTTLMPRIRVRLDARRPSFAVHPLVTRLAVPLAATILVLIGVLQLSTDQNRDGAVRSLQPLIRELTGDEVSDVLNSLDSVPLDADPRSAAESLFEERMAQASIVPRHVLREALAEEDIDLEVDQLTGGLEEEDWTDVLTKLDERTLL